MRTCPFCDEHIRYPVNQCPSCRADLEGSYEEAETEPAGPSIRFGCVVAWAIGGAVAAVLITLFVQAVSQAREAARRSQCRGHFKQLGLALHNYHDLYGTFPPAYVADGNGRPMHSWRVLILPFIDQQALYDTYDFAQPWDSEANRFVLENMPRHLACPSCPDRESIYTNYAAVTGPGTIFDGPEAVAIRDITDGTRRTLLIGEVRGARIPWTSPQDVDVRAAPRISDPGGFGSHHAGGAIFLTADGAVRFISEGIPQQTLDALYTRAGGEEIDDF